MILGILAGAVIARRLSLLVILRAGMALFWDILLPGMLLGVIVDSQAAFRNHAANRALIFECRNEGFILGGSQDFTEGENTMKAVTRIVIAGLLVAAMFEGQRTSAASGGAAASGN